jgi:hypothetical protein
LRSLSAVTAAVRVSAIARDGEASRVDAEFGGVRRSPARRVQTIIDRAEACL